MDQLLPEHVPVLVVGAGPTGLLCANLLGTYGIETLLVEQNRTTSDLPRAILLDDEGLRTLQAVGLAEQMVDKVIFGYGARYYGPDGSCFAEVESPVTLHGYPRRNSFLQPDLERVLAAGLNRFSNVRAMFETRLLSLDDTGDKVTAAVERDDSSCHEFSCDFVLACDGAGSGIRQHLNIAMPGMTDARDWVVVDTANDPDHDRFSKFYCDPGRPLVSIPAPGGGRRYEYMILPGEDPTEMVARKTIGSVLSQFRKLSDAEILRAVVYTFHARVAERLVAGRIAILGDAAHLSPPFAGQGMNAGLRDAFNVAWKVKLAIDGMADARILQTYETERKDPITEMINYAVALGRIVMPERELDEAAKREIRANLGDQSAGPGQAVSVRPKPQAVYNAGWRMAADQPSGAGLTGSALPQFPVQTADCGTRLLDDVLGSGFALVAIGPSAADALAGLNDEPSGQLRLKRIALHFAEPATTLVGVESVFVPGDDFGVTAHPDCILLVRPDRFVAGQWSAESVSGMAREITELCCI